MLVEKLLRPEVLGLKAYHVQDAQGLVKLDAMENPYPWPEKVVDEWLDRLGRAEPNRYPDPDCVSLKAALRKSNDIPLDAGLLLGNGSDEIIQIILMALRPGSTVMAPEPTFVMYRQISASLGLPFVGVPLKEEDFALDVDPFLALMAKHSPAVVFLAYPNNPTGNLFDKTALESVLEAAPGLVVIDEAYAPYADASFMSQAGRRPNLLVMRTLSKLGLAGLRLGFMAGAPAWLDEFEKIRLPYNINILTQISAEFALAQKDCFDAQIADIRRDRERMMNALSSIDVIHVYQTHANFILLRLLRHDASEVFARLKSAGILIKNLSPNGGSLQQCLRVTVGTGEENAKFLDALRHILAE